MTKRFCLNPLHSPTYYNICHVLKQKNWQATSYKWRAHFSQDHFDFFRPVSECLEFKHLLSDLVRQYCPKVMPVTYCINDDNAFLCLAEIAQYDANGVWILKPALQNNGQNIKIFQNLNQVKRHYESSNRLGGQHVLQQYLLEPHLLQGPEKGHKYSLRLFVVLTNYAGSYVYPNGYFNVALNPYQVNDFTDQRSHLTNEHLEGQGLNVAQIPTPQYPVFDLLYPKIKTILEATMQGLQKKYPYAFNEGEKNRRLAIFGFDFMVDSEMRVWLLEANHGPCFPISDNHPLQKKLYDPFWEALVESFVLPIASHQPVESIQYSLFEPI